MPWIMKIGHDMNEYLTREKSLLWYFKAVVSEE